jgi:hypothetical protein
MSSALNALSVSRLTRNMRATASVNNIPAPSTEKSLWGAKPEALVVNRPQP